MNNNELAPVAHEAEMPRRDFLRKSILLALPFAIGGFALPAAAAVYVPPRRARGTTRISVRDAGAVGNGVHDDTSAFQLAISRLPAAGGTVYVPAGNYAIDPTRNVRLRSKMHLELAPGAKLLAKRNSADRAYVLMVYKVSDVEISGGEIVGDRDNHLGTTGEWGHGIMIRGSSRVTVRDMRISKCWGDGISIGGAMVTNQPSIPCYDVAIANIVSTGNRRQALSIGRSSMVRVYDSEFSYTTGLAPGCGIDIEPDADDMGTASNIHIENCTIKRNQGNGIQVYKRVSGVTIKANVISYNGGYAILAIGSKDAYVAGNWMNHNYLEGMMIRVASSGYTVSGNSFRNNKTRLWGIKLDSPFVWMTGLVAGSTGNGAHIQVTSDTSNIRVTSNQFAK